MRVCIEGSTRRDEAWAPLFFIIYSLFEGYYYYLMTMSRALHAWGATNIETAEGVEHDWANDIIDQLVDLQRDDGSWVNQSSRWMENDPNLATANALIALTHALK